jgi:hypothetical protein
MIESIVVMHPSIHPSLTDSELLRHAIIMSEHSKANRDFPACGGSTVDGWMDDGRTIMERTKEEEGRFHGIEESPKHSRLKFIPSSNLATFFNLSICQALTDFSVKPIFGN